MRDDKQQWYLLERKVWYGKGRMTADKFITQDIDKYLEDGHDYDIEEIEVK